MKTFVFAGLVLHILYIVLIFFDDAVKQSNDVKKTSQWFIRVTVYSLYLGLFFVAIFALSHLNGILRILVICGYIFIPYLVTTIMKKSFDLQENKNKIPLILNHICVYSLFGVLVYLTFVSLYNN